MSLKVIQRDELYTELIYNERTYSISSELQDTKLFIKTCTEKSLISIKTKEVYSREDAIREHKRAVEEFKKIMLAENPGESIKRVTDLIEGNNPGEALLLTREVRFFHPSDPYMMCLDGYLTALVEKRYRDGINLCNQAISSYTSRAGIGKEFFLPFFYLYLGRTYLIKGDKRHAADCFYRILEIDSENREAIRELSKLGIRKRPVIPFLKRSNPINKYLGILRSKLSGKRIEKNKSN